MRVLISGATGLIATELIAQLESLGHEPIRLVRREARSADEVYWNPAKHDFDHSVLETIDAVVNLAGATTGKIPWTSNYKEELIESRIESTKTLVEAMAKVKNKPKVFISGSASGFYGDTYEEWVSENAPKGTGFLSDLAANWENEALKAPKGVRVVLIRTTMVFSKKLGALGRLLPLLKLGIGGALGSGKQWWAWISVPDEAAAIIHLINTESASGAYNLTAPEPATCKQIIDALGLELNRPTFVAVPAFALRLLLGEAAQELLLCNQKLKADRLIETGFKFQHPDLKSAAHWVIKG
jgi:uncharacterized protein (TIGR01777 family)